MFEKRLFTKTFIVGAAAAFAMLSVAAWYLWHAPVAQSRDTLVVGNTTVAIEVARTSEEQARGLGDRASIDMKKGMLFIFPEPLLPAFWMKDMRFPIDIVWVKNDRVLGFEENVDPQIGALDNELKTYEPPDTVDSVVELHAGAVKAFGLRVGDEVKTDPYLDTTAERVN